MAEDLKIIVLEGDETGQELLEQALRVLDPDVLGLEAELVHYDLSLENRRETDNAVVTEAAEAMREAGFGLKAATVTPEGKDDVGSPNRILREEVDGKVIIRTGRRIPGVVGPVVGRPLPDLGRADGGRGRLRRQAVARGHEGADDEVAYRTEKITRSTCRAVAEYAFRTAERTDGRRLRRAEVDRLPRLRGHAQGGDGRGGRAPPGRRVPAGADRRDLRGPDLGRRRDAAGDPRAQPRRRLPVGPRAADVRLDRRRRVGAAGLRRRPRDRRRDGRGAARHRAVAAGQGPRQPDGDDPRLRGRCSSYAHAKGIKGADRASRAIYESVLETIAGGVKTSTSAATRPRASSPTR